MKNCHPKKSRLKRIISGGQTGADRAALDWAINNAVPHGGWCPKGRMAVDGVLAVRYLLTETESEGYRHRPETLNVAGPREQKRPGIYTLTYQLLDRLAVEISRS